MTLFDSFKNAFNGIWFCIRQERNFRIHIVLALYALCFSKYYSFDKIDYIALCVLFSLVMGVEMINTAIEQFIDIKIDNFNFKAKAAKDIAAGAVCVCAIFAVIVGFILYFDIPVILGIVQDFLQYPLKIVALSCSLVLSVLFVKFGLVRDNHIS